MKILSNKKYNELNDKIKDYIEQCQKLRAKNSQLETDWDTLYENNMNVVKSYNEQIDTLKKEIKTLKAKNTKLNHELEKSILVFKNCEVDKKTLNDIKKTGAVSINGNDADVKFINRKDDEIKPKKTTRKNAKQIMEEK